MEDDCWSVEALRDVSGVWPLNSEFNGLWRTACPYQSYADMRHSSLRLRPQPPPSWGRIFGVQQVDEGIPARWRMTTNWGVLLKHILMGIDGSITHISIVSISLSLGTLWNGLSFPARAEAVSLPLARRRVLPKRWQVDKEIEMIIQSLPCQNNSLVASRRLGLSPTFQLFSS
jgi:hypothetical protein